MANPRRRPEQSSGGDEKKQGIWSSMLDSAASGKRLAEKQLLVLGGTPSSQKAFLEALSPDTPQSRRGRDRAQAKKPPIANRFALGYTYQDVLDADHEDILARLSVYMLSDPHPSFSKLFDPLFAADKIPETLAIVLLDWSSPWTWLRQLCTWIRFLKSIAERLDPEAISAMDENMKQWSERKKGVSVSTGASTVSEANVGVTLGSGEWDEPLGIPLCVVCQDAEKIEIFEREHGWKDDEFDYILQHLRTVLLKHGSSLIYTASAASGQLQPLVRASLGITSLLEKTPIKHNVVDRDKVCVPPNWDSWGKIRVLKEGFDAEAVSRAWSVDIDQPLQLDLNSKSESAEKSTENQQHKDRSAVSMYEEGVQNPNAYGSAALSFGVKDSDSSEVHCPDNQEFFARQLTTLDQLKVQDDADQKARDAKRPQGNGPMTPRKEGETASSISEHIGPVQMNMGGIQVDADEMLQSFGKDGSKQGTASATEETATPKQAGPEKEYLNKFFADMIVRGSPQGSPKPSNSPKQG